MKDWKGEILLEGDPRLGMPDVEIKEIPVLKKRYIKHGFDADGNAQYHPMVQMNANNYLEMVEKFRALAAKLEKVGPESDDREGIASAIAVVATAYPTIDEEGLWELHFAALLPLAYDAMNAVMDEADSLENLMKDEGYLAGLSDRAKEMLGAV